MGVGARATLVAVLVTLLVSALSGSAAPAGSGRRAGPPAPPGALASPEVASYRSARDYASVPVPVRVRVPAAGVDSALQPLGRNPDGTIAVPDNPDVAGWFSEKNWGSTVVRAVSGMLLALAVIYAGGWSWLAVLTGVRSAFVAGVVPFVAADVVKIAIAAALLPQAQRVIAR